MNNNGQQHHGLNHLGRPHVIFTDTKVDTMSQLLQQLATQHCNNKTLIEDKKRSSTDSLKVVKDKKTFKTDLVKEGKQIRQQSSKFCRLLEESEDKEEENRKNVVIADKDVNLAVEKARE